MALTNPESVMKALEDGTIESVKAYFPLVGKKHSLTAEKVYAGVDQDIDDIASQKRARLRGRTWSTPIFGDFVMRDVKTNKVIDRKKKVRILNLPKITKRYSYIVDGTGYQADHQMRLKSGVYARKKANGQLEAQVNLSKGRGFRMDFDPQKRKFTLKYGTSNVPLFPVLRAMGVSEDQITSSWGSTLSAATKKSGRAGTAIRLAKLLDKNAAPETDEEAAEVIQRVYGETELGGDVTKVTLGKEFNKVDGDALLATANKLLAVAKGTATVDNREALRFKEIWSIEDHIPERITNSKRRIMRKLVNNLDRREDIRSVITSDIFNVPTKAFFTSSALAQQSNQTNPMDIIGGFLRTTIMGTGGIQSEQAIGFSAKLNDSSQLGFIDPVHTPEGSKSGISTHLTLGLRKNGHDPEIRVYSTKEKKWVFKNPAQLAEGNIGFPDEYVIDKGAAPKPRNKRVSVIPKGGGDVASVSPGEVDFVLQSTKALYSITANMVPFLPSNQANRAGMATRHLEQAISMVDREAPLVQTVSGHPEESLRTWEKVVGKFVSFRSPVDGEVVSVGADKITVKGKDNKKHVVQIYDNFPLNEKKAFMHSDPLVKKGDAVKKGQVIADTNFTKDGTLAMGKNLRIAYLSIPETFEDGIVISEAAAENTRSVHLHKERGYLEKNMVVGLKKFRANYPGEISNENAEKLDDDGVIKKGMKVAPGDTIITMLQKVEPSKEQLLLRGIHRSLVRPFKNKSVTWDKPYAGVVTDVVRNGREMQVLIKTVEVTDIGDKFTARHGNKGVITRVVPTEEMPRDKDGNPVDIIVAPQGVPGRINPSQVLETALGELAHKRGEDMAVDNFATDNDKRIIKVKGHYRVVNTKDGKKRIWIESHKRDMGYQEIVSNLLKENDVSETTELFDPVTGKSFGKVLVGRQYFLKLMHQVDKKLSARAHGYGYEYDANLAPKSGGKTSAQRFGELGTYALLAHGAVHNLRDSLGVKSDKQQDDVWTAVQMGQILPAPKPAFAYEKFLAYLQALGVNVEKEGNELTALPLTEAQIKKLSNGEIKEGGKVIRGKDMKPEKNGLFDEDITGGPGGKKFAHIKMGEKMPNPLFEKAILALLKLKGKDYDAIIAGDLGYADGEAKEGAPSGPAAIVAAIAGLDVKKELAAAEADVKTARRAELDRANKKVKYLRMLDKTGISASEAYVLSSMPVIPPIFRPITAMEGGDLNVDGLNLLYRDVALINKKLGEAKGVLPEEEVAGLRADLYDAVEALMGTGSPSQNAFTLDGQDRPPGILQILSGRNSPKQSFFHQRLLNRRQDLSMRSVIVPNMDMALDEIGLPRKGAMKIFRPFVVRELVKMGYAPLAAREEIDKGTALANKALNIAVSKRPVLFKRDPILHKFGIMAFKPKLHDKLSIHIHPLVTGGFNADFDGDQMGVFVPVSQEAVEEAYRMLPSKNLFNPATGKVMYQPSLAGQLGIFLLTTMGKDSRKSYKNHESAVKAYKDGENAATDVVSVGGKKTTAGRILLYNTLPKALRTDAVLTDPKAVMSKKNLQKTLRALATNHPAAFAETIDKIKDLGFGHAYKSGFSFDLDDFAPLSKMRSAILTKADKAADAVHRGGMSKAKKDAAIVKIYKDATAEMAAQAPSILRKKGSRLQLMNDAGIKPGWAQLQQLVLGPMLVTNAEGRTIPVPITKSYSEGLTSSQYWVGATGARKGLVDKVLAVQKPGALSKQIVNTAIPYVITSSDCGTSKGIALDTADIDVVDRFTASSIKAGGKNIAAGTLVTPNMLSSLRAAKVSRVSVRSPLKCRSKKGMCSKCYGVMDGGNPIKVGTNIGVIAGQSIGERGTQLSMRTFHSGGIVDVGSKGSMVDTGGIDRVSEILKMPAILPDKATISTALGKVSSVVKSDVGGWNVTVGSKDHYVPSHKELKVKKGDDVKKGQALSSGKIDPRELLEQTSIDAVQRYLSGELHNIYAGEGIKKRNVEVVVKALTNLGKITDPGDSDELVRGDYVQLNYANSLNRDNKFKNPVKVEPLLRGVETLPLDSSTDWMARLQYRRLKETYTRAVNEGWSSNIHGLSPVPGIAYGAELGKPPAGSSSPY